MAARNTADNKRLIYRPSDKDPEAYSIPVTRSGSIKSQPLPPPTSHVPPEIVRSADVITPGSDASTPVRRIVVVRNTKNSQVDQGPVDLSDFGRPNSFESSSVVSDGYKSIVLIRRPIVQPESVKPVESYQSVQEPSPTTSLENIRTPTPPPSPSLIRPRTSKRPTSSSRTRNSQRHSPSPRRPNSKLRPPSINRTDSKHHSSSSPPQQEEPTETDHTRQFFYSLSKENTTKSPSPPSLAIIENEKEIVQHRPTTAIRSALRKKSATSQAKSLKSAILIHSDELKRPKSFKKTRFQDEINDESTEALAKRSRWQTCLGCLTRYMCLIIIICFLLIVIGLAGVGVSAYFIAIDSTNNLVPKILGLVIGGLLAITALCFLCILLWCLSSHDGYFAYKDDVSHVSGRSFAPIPPSHPNAHLYTPHDHIKMSENNLMQPISTVPYTHQQKLHRSNTVSTTNSYDNKSNKNNITIEMPESFLTGRQNSPRSRERSLTKVVRNINHVVEDAKKRYNGDVPNKVIVKMDPNAMQTA